MFTKFFEHVSHFFSNFTQSKVKAIDGWVACGSERPVSQNWEKIVEYLPNWYLQKKSQEQRYKL